MQLDNLSSIPLYHQLCNQLRKLIENEVYGAGRRIPSESDLSRDYSVSRVTVRKAIDILIDEGVLVRRHGLGTFVTSPVFIESPYARGSFAASCRQQGVEPSTKILFSADRPADGRISADMNLSDGAAVFEIHRLRLANGLASIYEIDYLPSEMGAYLEGVHLEDISLLAAVQEGSGLQYDGVEDMIDVENAAPEIAAALGCEVRAPLLRIYQKVMSSSGTVMYINYQYIRSDRYKYVCSSLRRDQITIEKSPKS